MGDYTWARIIILVDMNAFFAAVEQYDRAEWRAKPLAVTNGAQGTCIITCSYEARAYGVKTGMRLKEARLLCPGLIQVPARPERYVHVSQRIMRALQTITPDIELFSIDEAFLDVTYCQRLYGTPEEIGRRVKQVVWEVSGLTCSIGISCNKSMAKYAAKLNKPNGFTILPPHSIPNCLKDVPVTELCGIGHGVARYLASFNAYTCDQVARLPVSVLAKRFGNLGRRIWLMCQGRDIEPLQLTIPFPKSMGHGKVLPPSTTEPRLIATYLLHMSEKLAARLRRHDLIAQYFFIGLRNRGSGWLGIKAGLIYSTQDGLTIYRLGLQSLAQVWQGQPVTHIQVTALAPIAKQAQHSLWQHEQRERLNAVIDQINQRFGPWSIMLAPLLQRSQMPNVIAPAWKPNGHRENIFI